MNIGNEIKKIAIDNCVTLTTLAEYISEQKKSHILFKIYLQNLKKEP